jgi:RNA polymerase sigma factor (sigma-70 family)
VVSFTLTAEPVTADDGELLSAYAERRDADVFAELVRRYGGLVYATARRVTGSSADAEDVCQECFMELARQARRVRCSLGGWLHTAATRMALHANRSAGRRRRLEQDAWTRPTATDAALWEQIEPLVDAAIARLPDELREALVMHYLRGVSQTELAGQMRVDQSTVSRRIERGLARLRERLSFEGITTAITPPMLSHLGGPAAPPHVVQSLIKIGLVPSAAASATAAGSGIVKAIGIAAVWAVAATGMGLVLLARRPAMPATTATDYEVVSKPLMDLDATDVSSGLPIGRVYVAGMPQAMARAIRNAGDASADFTSVAAPSGFAFAFAYKYGDISPGWVSIRGTGREADPQALPASAAEATGLAFRGVSADDRDAFWSFIREHVDRDQAVLSEELDGGIYAGYRVKEGVRQVLFTGSPANGWHDVDRTPPVEAAVLERRGEPIRASERLRRGLHAAVDAAHAGPSRGTLHGLAGLDAFAADVADLSKDFDHCQEYLCWASFNWLSARRAAAAWLSEAADDPQTPEPIRATLRQAASSYSDAAAAYTRFVDEVARIGPDQARNQTRSFAETRAHAARPEILAMLQEGIAAEKRGAQQIEKALPLLQKLSGDPFTQDTASLVIAAAAEAQGVQATYEDVFCLSGNAFSPMADLSDSCNSWWHVEAWMAIQGFENVGRRYGLTLRDAGVVPPGTSDGNLRNERMASAVKARDEGATILTLGGLRWIVEGSNAFVSGKWAGIVTRLDPQATDDSSITAVCFNGRGDNWVENSSYLWGLRATSGPRSSEGEAYVGMLRLAVARWNSRPPFAGSDKELYGRKAVDAWIGRMETNPGFCQACTARGKPGCAGPNAIAARHGATVAAAYLRRVAPSLPDAARTPLLAAAGHYDRVVSLLTPFSTDAAYRPVLGDLALQKQHAQEVLVPMRDEYAAAADEMQKALDASARTATLDLGDGVEMQFVLITAGEFDMGEPPGQRRRIATPFYMGKHLVTRKQFVTFVRATGFRTDAEKEGTSPGVNDGQWQQLAGANWDKPGFEQTDDHPVVCVSPNDAMAYCRWLSERTGRVVRLPRDAEWEYACRAGTQTQYFWGDDPMAGVGYMNAEDGDWKIEKGPRAPADAKWSDGYRFTSPVTAMKPNPWGLHDMLGNLWEPTTDPMSWRGGTWDYPAHLKFNRCAHRQDAQANGNSWDTGFRVAMDGAVPQSSSTTKE